MQRDHQGSLGKEPLLTRGHAGNGPQQWQLGTAHPVRGFQTLHTTTRMGKADGVTKEVLSQEGELWLRPGWRHVCRPDWADIQIKTFLETVQTRPQSTVLLLDGKQMCPAQLREDSVLGNVKYKHYILNCGPPPTPLPNAVRLPG